MLKIKPEQWIAWTAAVGAFLSTAALTLAAYSFTTFETKEHAREILDYLIRIENKVEAIRLQRR